MKNKKVQNILVYTDFTEIGNKSIEWGIFFAQKFKRGLQIVHVINENSNLFFNKWNIYNDVKFALEKLCDEIHQTYNINCEYYFDEGCTCTIINTTAERVDAFLVVIGNHGKNDPQFLSGTSLIKIVRKSRIPYFIVQKKSLSPDNKKSIVFPIDSRKEMKEKTGWVTYFAKNIGTHIKLLVDGMDDERVINNIKFCSNFFEKYNLNYNIEKLNKSPLNIDKFSLKLCSNDDTFCLAIITTKNENFLHKIFGFPETTVISNSKHIPVLCINPKKNLYIPCL